MISFITDNLLWFEGAPIVVALLVGTIAAFRFYRPLLYVVFGCLLFSLYFFRNPERVCPQALRDNTVIVSPADGKVVDVSYDAKRENGYPHKVSIFLSPFDVHVNWAPIEGVIKDITYKPGTFMMAFLPKSSEFNERNDLLIANDRGQSVVVRQIAGTIARRICCWKYEGDAVLYGDKYGMIRFGSRVDVFLPEGVSVDVGVGQTMYGGQTVLGTWQ